MSARLNVLRKRLEQEQCDAFLSFSPPANQYLTGFTGSTSAVIVTADNALFLCDFRYTEQAEEEVRGFTTEEFPGAMEAAAGKCMERLGMNTVAYDPAVMTVASLHRLERAFDGTCRSVADIMTAQRSVKDADEIAAIRAAVELSEGVLADAMDILTPGITERALAAWFEFEFKKRGASCAAFDTIALFGPRTSLVHGQPSDRALISGDIILLDFGCRLNGYCSDLTRTYVYGTISDIWLEEVHELVRTAQHLALEAIRPGIRCCELDAIARDLIADNGYGEHFGHGLGHGVGIDIHEGPRLHKESSTVLEAGMIVTVEPGIYLPGRGGIRIEDLVAVTKDGCELLSSAPTDLKVIDV